MENALYFENAHGWLNAYIEDERRFLKLSALGLIIVAVLAMLAGLYVLGWYSLLGLIILAGVAYWVCGGFRAEEPLINAQTSRPRLLGVPRSQMGLAWWSPEQIRREMAFVIGMLTAPVSLPMEAWKMKKRRDRLAEVDTHMAAVVLALITERDAAWLTEELNERLGEETATKALGDLCDVGPTVWLQDPDRISVTDAVQEKIRAI